MRHVVNVTSARIVHNYLSIFFMLQFQKKYTHYRNTRLDNSAFIVSLVFSQYYGKKRYMLGFFKHFIKIIIKNTKLPPHTNFYIFIQKFSNKQCITKYSIF